jgi:hypothetical protein
MINNSSLETKMNKSHRWAGKRTLAVATAYGSVIGFFAYVAMNYPWYVTGTLLDTEVEVNLVPFIVREFIPFLQMSPIWPIAWSMAGACVGLVVFALLWRRQGKVIWRQGCPLVALLLAIPFGWLLIFAQGYIKSRYTWPWQEYGLLPSVPVLAMSSLLVAISGLVCLTPVGLVLGITFQAMMKARRKYRAS